MSYHKLLSARLTLATLLATAQELGSSRELSLAVSNIQSCRMLLGSVAGMMGAPNPYPQADNPASGEIRPTSDMPEEMLTHPLPADPVAAVKTVRALAEESIQDLHRLRTQLWPKRWGNFEESLFDAALVDLHRAKQFLGEQLAVIAGHPLVRTRPANALLGEVNLVEIAARYVGGNRQGKNALATLIVDEEIRLRLLAAEPITEICRDLDVTEYRVLKVRDAGVNSAAPCEPPAPADVTPGEPPAAASEDSPAA